ncbi:MAG: DUF4917 family protein [Actinomycetota bacterium]
MSDTYQWSGLLLGNGASRAVWPGFDYPSLYDRARMSTSAPLEPEAVRVFEALGSTNFEYVLRSLGASARINVCLDLDAAPIHTIYDNVRLALAGAVQASHVNWNAIEHLRAAVTCF